MRLDNNFRPAHPRIHENNRPLPGKFRCPGSRREPAVAPSSLRYAATSQLATLADYTMSTNASKRKTPWWVMLVCIFFSPLLLIVIPVLVVLFFALLALYLISTFCLHIIIWFWWCWRGHDILFVYSDSPIWHDYIEQQVLPHLGERAVVLNWSQRKRWRLSLARMAFYHFGSYRQFNPLGVVFRPFRRTRTFRFWQPFRDFKHGHPDALQKMETEFFQLIGVHKHEPSA